MTTSEGRTGGCLCGQVRFTLTGTLRPVTFCHCRQCQKTHGSFGAYTAVETGGITMLKDSGLSWYRSSATARRGFCRSCGSSLFWEPSHGRYLAVAAGSLDDTEGLAGAAHIFVADKGCYYTIADGLPQYFADSGGAAG